MGLFNFKKKLNLKVSSKVGITQAGKMEAQNYSSRGTQFAILAALSERSPMSVGDLADETQIDIGELKHWLAKMTPNYIIVTEE